MPYSWTDMILYFFIYSFCGWLMETVLCSFQEKHFVNRGFLNGPICPIYGCGILLILTFLLPVRNDISRLEIALPVIFFAGAMLASAVEYFTSWLMEKLFHARWWDYSQYKHNLNGRICLPISLAWGGLATTFVYLIQPQFEKLVHTLYGWNTHLPIIVAVALCAVLVADCVLSFRIAKTLGNKLEHLDKLGELIKAHVETVDLAPETVMIKLEDAYDRYESRKHVLVERLQTKSDEWRTMTAEKRRNRLQSKAEELKKLRENTMRNTKFLQKRMLRAFPTMKQKDGSRTLNELKELLRKDKDGKNNKYL